MAEHLHDAGPTDSARDHDRADLDVVDAVAERLGNTRAVARSCYVDPRVPKAYRLGALDDAWDHRDGAHDHLSPAERAVQRVLELDLPPTLRTT